MPVRARLESDEAARPQLAIGRGQHPARSGLTRSNGASDSTETAIPEVFNRTVAAFPAG